MTTLSAYVQTWRLKLSHAKTVMAITDLHNREAKRELKVKNNGEILPFRPVLTYLVVKLDRVLTYRHHLKVLRKKLSTCVLLLRRLTVSRCFAGAKTFHTASLSLIYSIAEYCAPACCRNAHTLLIDSVLGDALRIVTRCLRPTPTAKLPVFLGIQSGELSRQKATFFAGLALTTFCLLLATGYILHGQLTKPQADSKERLKSRHPFAPAARQLLHNLCELGIHAAQWTNLTWDAEYSKSMSAFDVYISWVSTRPIGISLTRTVWVKLNRLRTGVRRFGSSMLKWGLASSGKCKCGASKQTADHII